MSNSEINFYNTSDGRINKKVVAESSVALSHEIIAKYGSFGSGLIMGYGDGFTVDFFKDKFDRLIVLEGADAVAESAGKKMTASTHVVFRHTYFEKFKISQDEKVSVVLGNHVLEHVASPVEVMKESREWLNEDGIAIFTVPNANSLHRQIGVELGMIETVSDLNYQDKLVGHERVYSLKALLDDTRSAGYEILEVGGFNLKLVSQKQMEGWSRELLAAIYSVSRRCPPEICSNLYVVCKV